MTRSVMGALRSSGVVVAAGLALAACGSSGGGRHKGGGSKLYKATPAAADELTKGMRFPAGAEVVEGAPVGITVDPVDSGSVNMQPGQSGNLTLDAAQADPADPVVARVVYMDGSGSFIRVPVQGDGKDAGKFTIDPSVCQNLCSIIHQVKCYEAAETKSGTITKANLTTVILDCQGQEGAPPVYAGEWKGKCDSMSVSGTFQMCVSAEGSVSGMYSGADSGSIGGTVSSSGSFQTGGGSAGGCSWTGTLGSTSGSGSWSCTGGFSDGCTGSWTGK